MNIQKLLSEKSILFITVLFFFTVSASVSLHRYWQYAAWYYDFGIFYQAISLVSQGKEPIIDHFVYTGQNILGDHFHPLIFLVSPFVSLFKRGEVLLLFQSFFVAISGFPIYLTAKNILKNKLEAFSILIIYFSFIGLHNALISEFHEITLLPLPLSLFFYGMVTKKQMWYYVGLLGTLLTKESTFIIPAWFGLVVAFKHTGVWRKIGIITSLISVLYGWFVMNYVFVAFNGEGYRYISDTFSSGQKVNLLNQLKVDTVWKTVISFGFLPFFAPETLPPVLFNWWSRFSSIAVTRHNLGLHYNAEITPTLALGSMYGWNRIKVSWQKLRISKKLSKFFSIIFERKLVFRKKYGSYTLVLIAVATVFFSFQILKSPFLLFVNPAFFAHTKNLQFLDNLIAQIPEQGIVMAQTNIAAKLAYRKVLMLRENYGEFNPDFIVIDLREGQEPNNFYGVGDFEKLAKDLAADTRYELYYSNGDQRIYKRSNFIENQ